MKDEYRLINQLGPFNQKIGHIITVTLGIISGWLICHFLHRLNRSGAFKATENTRDDKYETRISHPELPWVDAPVASYQGQGILTPEDGQQISCSFACAQLPNGQIRFICSWDPYKSSFSTLNSPKLSAFEGKTFEGKKLVTEGNLTVIGYKVHFSREVESRANLNFLTSILNVYHQQNGEDESIAKKIVFGCTNFKFLGTVASSRGLALPLRFGPHEVIIYPVPQYKEVIEKLRVGKGIEVTCEIIFEVKTKPELDKILITIRHLCLMLSLARGTLVNWIYYNTYSDDEQQLVTVHHDSPTRPFSSMQLLHYSHPEHLSHFIETCYDQFVEKFELYSLDEVVGAFVDTRGTGFLETRGLAAASLIDVLRGRWAEAHYENRGYVIPEQDFENYKSELKRRMKQMVREVIPNLNGRQADKMAAHVPELNRVIFRLVLIAMLNALGVPHTEEELNDYINSRNSLVHRGRYRSQPIWNEYVLILSLLDRVILKLIGYSGNYVDCRDWELKQV